MADGGRASSSRSSSLSSADDDVENTTEVNRTLSRELESIRALDADAATRKRAKPAKPSSAAAAAAAATPADAPSPPKGSGMAIDAFSATYARFTFSRSPWREFSVRFHYSARDYPSDCAVCEVTSAGNAYGRGIPRELCTKLQASYTQLIASNRGRSQIAPVVAEALRTVNDNLLLPAWAEVRDLARRCKQSGDTFKPSEAKGTVRLACKRGQYKLAFSLSLDALYPARAVTVDVSGSKSSFPERYRRLFADQAQSVARKLASTQRAKYEFGRDDLVVETREESIDVNRLKSDMRFLMKQSDLRQQSGEKKKRRELRVMSRRELEDEKERAAARERERQELEARLLCSGDPTPSLLETAEYLIVQCLELVSQAECTGCEAALLPPNPAKLAAMEADPEKKNAGKYPQRVICGHWWHHKCLDKFITEPPFGKVCPTCQATGGDTVVTHALWPADISTLERMWALEQAKSREIGDVMDFLA